jgi:hypothetical protein
MKNENFPWIQWIFTLSFILITFLPRSLDDSMFMDGLVYASIARNMAIGKGSFFQPYFADSFWLPYDNDGYFYGHPPLQFGLESVLFRVFGDTPFVENIYNLLVLIATIVLLVAIWKRFFKGSSLQSMSWLPVLCWYSMLIVWYGMPNNFLDSTMAVFCLLSCYFQLCAFESSTTNKQRIVFLLLAGFSIFLSVMTKGPVGLYPLAFSGIYLLFYKKSKFIETVLPTILLVSAFAFPLLLLFFYEPARFFFSKYFEGQVVNALLQKREKVSEESGAHLYLLKELFRSVWPHITATIALYLIAWFAGINTQLAQKTTRIALVCFMVAASGILPMLVSVKQYHHYLLPAMPFVALLFAVLISERLKALYELNPRLSRVAALLAACCCWVITFQKLNYRKENVIGNNTRHIMKYVPHHATLGVCNNLLNNPDIYAYSQRYNHMSLCAHTDTTTYTLVDAGCVDTYKKIGHELVSLEGNYFLLIKKSAGILSSR